MTDFFQQLGYMILCNVGLLALISLPLLVIQGFIALSKALAPFL